MQYLDNFLHLPDLIPLKPEEARRIPERDEDERYQELKDRRLEDGRADPFHGGDLRGSS